MANSNSFTLPPLSSKMPTSAACGDSIREDKAYATQIRARSTKSGG
jgi:hypothetical protein